MSHRELKARVAAAEQRVDAHLRAAAGEAGRIGGTVKRSFTPLRLLLAGLAAGTLAGWARLLTRARPASRLLRTLGAAPGLLAALTPWLELLRQQGEGDDASS